MGYDLAGSGGRWRWTIWAWPKVLRIAYKNGWKPNGTVIDSMFKDLHKNSGKDWNGTYFSNDGQFVTKRDSNNLAKALSKELKRKKCISKNDQYLKGFISFCKKGGFWIL